MQTFQSLMKGNKQISEKNLLIFLCQLSNKSSQTFNTRMVNCSIILWQVQDERLEKRYVDHIVNANEEIQIVLYFV